MTDMPFLPYGRQWIDDDDVAAVVRALRSDYLTTGPEIPAFEGEFAAASGVDHAVACSNGTTALRLVSHALGLGAGDAAIVPAITFLATANAPASLGARIVFADVDPTTGLMTAETFEEALAHAAGPVKAAFPVHLAGRPAPMEALADIACAHGVHLIEDACHALGTTWTDAGGAERRVGDCAFSMAATWSFHPVKTIACGEGGMITTRDAGLAATMRRMRSHGMVREPEDFQARDMAFDERVPNPWWYEMPEPGWNDRLPDINAALGRSQLAKLPFFARRRRALVALYRDALRALAPHVSVPADGAGVDAVHHLMNVLIDFEGIGRARRAVMERLRMRGVGSQVHYIPVHRQPHYRALDPDRRLPGADAHYAKTLSLPLYPAMADGDVARVVDALAAAIS